MLARSQRASVKTNRSLTIYWNKKSEFTVVRQQPFLESSAVPFEAFEVLEGARAEVHCAKKGNTTLGPHLAIMSSGEQETVEKALNGSHCFSTKHHCQIKNFLVSATLNQKQDSAGLPDILKNGCRLAETPSKMSSLHRLIPNAAAHSGQELSAVRWWLLLSSGESLPCSCLPLKKKRKNPT